MAKRPGGALIQTPTPTRSQLLPIVTKWQELGRKSELGAILFTLIVFFLLTSPLGSTEAYQLPVLNAGNFSWSWDRYWTSNFLILVAAYLTLASLYFIYRLVGKNKAWWILLACFAFSVYICWLDDTQGTFMWMYTFFHGELAGGMPTAKEGFASLFMKHFLGTGFYEVLFKAIPIFLLVIAGRFMPPALRERIGITEPLDGILLGAAAGGGFAIMETLGQYVSCVQNGGLVYQWLKLAIGPMHLATEQQVTALIAILQDPAQSPQLRVQALHALQQLINSAANIINTAPGAKAVIFRSIDLAFGHMAYSGYFGYFIGLSVLKPEKRWKILGIGLISAALPHALWDSIGYFDILPLRAVVAVGSYAILAAAILKAREISPNRAVLQPSIVLGAYNPQSTAGSAAWQKPAPMAAAAAATPGLGAPVAPPPLPNLPAGTLSLRIGLKQLVVVPGLRLLEHQVPGLQAQSPEGAVAEVTRNPNDPSILGLTNLSGSVWEVVTANGNRREIQPGGTIKLARGTKIDFGSTDGEVA